MNKSLSFLFLAGIIFSFQANAVVEVIEEPIVNSSVAEEETISTNAVHINTEDEDSLGATKGKAGNIATSNQILTAAPLNQGNNTQNGNSSG